jgi:hypothetical protein
MTSASTDSEAFARTVTPRVSRRAWIDPHVRTAWLAGAALLLIGAGILFQRISTWRLAAHLIEDGVPIDATVIEVNGSTLKGRSESGDRPLTLRVEYKGEAHEYRVPYLDGRSAEEPLVVGQTIPIRIDPADVNHWSPLQKPTPLANELMGGGIVVGTGVLLCIVAVLLRANVLKTYRDAPQVEAVVLSSRHAAIAPRAWQVRCSPVADGDDRVFTVYTPATVNVANATLRLLTPAHGRVLATEWFE